MSREEIQKLLGGYATDTLSEAERRALLEAALEDQELFDALAKEQALRDALREPAARQQLIEALGPARAPFAVRGWQWLRQPAVLAMAGGLAVLLLVAGLVLRQTRHTVRPEAMVADAITAGPPAAVPPRPAPVKPMEPRVMGRNPKRLVRLPAGRAAPAPAPPPTPPSAEGAGVGGLIRGAPADAGEAKSQMLPAPPATPAPAPVASLNGRARLPMAAGSLAKAKSAAAAKPAVPYTLLRKDADGAYTSVAFDTVLHAGDSVRLQVEPGEAGYVNLFQRAATGGWNLVESRPVEKGQRYVVPSTGGLESDVPARLELLLTISRGEQSADAGALSATAPAGSAIMIEYR
jgi:hypothetical protein